MNVISNAALEGLSPSVPRLVRAVLSGGRPLGPLLTIIDMGLDYPSFHKIAAIRKLVIARFIKFCGKKQLLTFHYKKNRPQKFVYPFWLHSHLFLQVLFKLVNGKWVKSNKPNSSTNLPPLVVEYFRQIWMGTLPSIRQKRFIENVSQMSAYSISSVGSKI